MVELLIGLYLLICILWASFARCMQRIVYPHNSGKLSLLINFLGNSVMCPISMFVAVIKFDLYLEKIKQNAIKEYAIKELKEK